MRGMGEHIDGLNRFDLIAAIQRLQVTGLCGRIARYIDNTFRRGIQNGLDNVRMHAGTRRVGNDNIRLSVFFDKIIGQDVFHIACIEQRVLNAVEL